jgi:hypothetical protein
MAAAFVAAHGVQTPKRARAICPNIARVPGQSVSLVDTDGSESTALQSLRTSYARTALRIAREAEGEGSYLVIDRFGSSIAGIETICETSTRIDAQAPLFADAKRTGLERALVGVSARATDARVSDRGTDVFAAIVDAVERANALRERESVPARIVVLTDGDQAITGVHLRRLLQTGSDTSAARRIVEGQAIPNARGIVIEIRGVGRIGAGELPSTRTVLRMVHVWQLICASTHAKRCLVSSELTD